MDLTAGMSAEVDEVAEEPLHDQFMEGANIWLWDGRGRIALPRVAVDAIGSRWGEAHMVSVNLALPGGRVLMVRTLGAPHPALDERGRPRIRGAGPLRFHCLEPFRRWRLTFDGLAGDTTIEEQIAHRLGGPGSVPAPTVPVRFDIEMDMTVTPFVAGSYEPEGTVLSTEHRFEQLCSASGQVGIGGETIAFQGGGLRIRRKGTMKRSDYSDWMGHVWMSAQFPGGRAFGMDVFHPRPDGSVRYQEGWLLDDGEILPAKFVEAPWKKDWIAGGEDVSFTLRTKRGDTRLAATTWLTTVSPVTEPPDGRTPFPPVQQGIVSYEWDGVKAYGMMERSSPAEIDPGR